MIYRLIIFVLSKKGLYFSICPVFLGVTFGFLLFVFGTSVSVSTLTVSFSLSEETKSLLKLEEFVALATASETPYAPSQLVLLSTGGLSPHGI